MAKKVSGITVEIGGDTTKLGKALAEVDGQSRSLQTELRGVESLLKFDPSNVELLRQKQEILNDSIDNTRKKLTVLKDTQEQVQAQFDRGEITAQQYRDFQREIVVTEQKLQGLGTELRDMYEAGEAIGEMSEDIEELGDNSAGAGDGLEGVTSRLDAGLFMQAAEQLGAVSEKLIEIGENAVEATLEIGQAQTDLKANFALTNEEAEALGDVVQNVFRNGVVDSVGEATEAVGTVKAAFGDLNNVELETLTNKIIGISTRTGTDVADNVRGADQLMRAMGYTGEEAFDLIAAGYQNNLDRSGDYMDTLTEYAPLFAEAGYSGEEMLSMLSAGLDNGARSTDLVADSVKELQIRLGDGTFEENLGMFSDSTSDAFQRWKDGEYTVEDVTNSIAADLQKMSPTEQQEALSVLGTQFEDLGIKGSLSILTVSDSFAEAAGAAEDFIEKSPGEEWQSSLRDLQSALIPIGEAIINALTPVLEALGKLGEWFSNLPDPVINFITIFGGLIAVVGTLAPIIAGIVALFTVFGSATLLPIIGIIVAVSAAIAGIIVAFQNWGAITDWLSEKWDQFVAWIGPIIQTMLDGISAAFIASVEWIKGVWAAIPEFFAGIWTGIQEGASNIWASVVEAWGLAVEYVKSIWTGITTFFSDLWLSITEATSAAWQVIVDAVMVVLNPFIETFNTIWTNISPFLSGIWSNLQFMAIEAWGLLKNIILAPVLMIVDLVTGDFESMGSHLSQIWINIQMYASLLWLSIKGVIENLVGALVAVLTVLWDNLKNNTIMIWELIKSTAINIWTALKDAVINGANALKDGAINAWNNVKTGVINAANGLKDGAVNAWNTLKSSVINAANGLKDGAVNAWNNLKSSVTNLANSAKDGAVNAWNNLKTMTANIFNGVVSSIKSILNINLFSIGRNIIDGLVNGIKNGVGAVGAAISEVAGNIKDKIKGALGINSPSRWMRDVVGKMIPQGIAVGVKADTSKALDAMDDLTAGVMDAGSPDMMKMMNGNSLVSQSAQMDALKSSLGASGTLAAKVDAMIGLLGTYLPNLNAEPKIVMDTGALVGEIKNEMNQSLGNDADLERRGR